MPDKAEGTLLYLDAVSKSFDGFRAINGLSLVLAPGEMRAIIGPNGAGKTTMMDIITGKTKPDTGDVLFEGSVDLTRMDEASIANLGIGRKFQKPTVFESHTVEDNIALALKSKRGPWATLFHARTPRRNPRGSTNCSPPPASPTSAGCSPPASPTARSSGWRSACCSPRSPASSSSTSPPPA